ncbi:hypothetical protein IT411_04285 [Candidatus Peregrinibacteria bacterium]|nr:hypothetical protein [Candidatus Peregrinibacteria bacterium]
MDLKYETVATGNSSKIYVCAELNGWFFKEFPVAGPGRENSVLLTHKPSQFDITSRPVWFNQLRKGNLRLIGHDLLGDPPREDWFCQVFGDSGLRLIVQAIRANN